MRHIAPKCKVPKTARKTEICIQGLSSRAAEEGWARKYISWREGQRGEYGLLHIGDSRSVNTTRELRMTVQWRWTNNLVVGRCHCAEAAPDSHYSECDSVLLYLPFCMQMRMKTFPPQETWCMRSKVCVHQGLIQNTRVRNMHM